MTADETAPPTTSQVAEHPNHRLDDTCQFDSPPPDFRVDREGVSLSQRGRKHRDQRWGSVEQVAEISGVRVFAKSH
jgi:hypothetical protein